MARGGKRSGAGRKSKPVAPPIADKGAAQRLLDALNQPGELTESYEIKEWRKLTESVDRRVCLDARKWLYEKRDGKAVQTVNHVHDKPLEVNHTVSVFEVIERARKRARPPA